MRINTRRQALRFKDVPFLFHGVTGGVPVEEVAMDASVLAASFRDSCRARVLDNATGSFALNGQRYRATHLHEVKGTGRKGVLILGYRAVPIDDEGFFAKLRRHLPFHRKRPAREGNPRQRYHKPNPWQLRREQVSRVHLYEAQERFVYLNRLLDYHESMLARNADRNGEKLDTIRICRAALDSASVLLTRRQHDLNFLWREMTQVHIMILEQILPDEVLPAQLDFCREELRRLGLKENPELEDMIQRTAEAMDEREENRTRKARLLRSLIERLNTIRTGRIHEQVVLIRCYQKALILLTLISLVLLFLPEHLLVGPRLLAPLKGTVEAVIQTRPGIRGIDSLVLFLGSHVIAFVLLGGLIGGFFSVVTRLRTRELLPGEDVLNRPGFSGAPVT
jgi:hypothetical protein